MEGEVEVEGEVVKSENLKNENVKKVKKVFLATGTWRGPPLRGCK